VIPLASSCLNMVAIKAHYNQSFVVLMQASVQLASVLVHTQDLASLAS
jgi:hypothetical protein